MWKFCTLTFLYGAVFLWHQSRSPSLAEVSAKHTWTVSMGPDEKPSELSPSFWFGQNLGQRAPDMAATAVKAVTAFLIPDTGRPLLSLTADRNHDPMKSLPGLLQEVAATGQCQGLNLCHVSDHKACAFNCQNVTSNKPFMLTLAASEQSKESAKGPGLCCL